MDKKILLLLILILLCLLIPFIIDHEKPAPAGKTASTGSVVSKLTHSQSQAASSGETHSETSILRIFDTIPSLEDLPNGMHSNSVITLKIIDISNWTSMNDWGTLRLNVDGVYMKATEGTTYTDNTLSANAAGAQKNKIPIGFYHYFWPSGDMKYIKQQADYFYNAIKPYPYDFYPALDIEETNGQKPQTIIAAVKAFAQEFKSKSGLNIILYCSPNFADKNLSDQSLKQYPLWIANYDVNEPKVTLVWNSFCIWQFNSNLTVPGVNGRVDTDIATNDIYIDKNKAPKS